MDFARRVPFIVYTDGRTIISWEAGHNVVRMTSGSYHFQADDVYEVMLEYGPIELTLIGVDDDRNIFYYEFERLTIRTL